MPDQNANIDNHSTWLPVVWASEALLQLPNYLVLAPRLNLNFNNEFATRGQKITIGKTGTLTVTMFDDKTPLSLSAPVSPGVVEVSLEYQPIVSFGASAALATLTGPDAIRAYTRDAVMAIAQKIDATIAAAYASLTGAYGTGNVDLDSDALPGIIGVLKSAKVPAGLFDIDGGVSLFCSIKDGTSFRRDTEFTDASKLGNMGGSPRITGRLGRYMGVDIYETQSIVTTGSTVYHNLALARDAMVLASRPVQGPGNDLGVRSAFISMPLGNAGEGELSGVVFRVDESWDRTIQSKVIDVSCLFGLNAVRPEWGVHVQS
jgi:hypothetical protein